MAPQVGAEALRLRALIIAAAAASAMKSEDASSIYVSAEGANNIDVI